MGSWDCLWNLATMKWRLTHGDQEDHWHQRFIHFSWEDLLGFWNLKNWLEQSILMRMEMLRLLIDLDWKLKTQVESKSIWICVIRTICRRKRIGKSSILWSRRNNLRQRRELWNSSFNRWSYSVRTKRDNTWERMMGERTILTLEETDKERSMNLMKERTLKRSILILETYLGSIKDDCFKVEVPFKY